MLSIYPEEPEGRMECCAVGPGGDRQLVNNNECQIIEAVVSGIQVRAEGMQEPGRH